ncbi:hypothetical protein, partial [Joostella sp. CR20]|uniref:hypothetical protein n=1 Tax=Joostella sp. CR20 TaxID=2804312 RepID=UPI00313ED2DE
MNKIYLSLLLFTSCVFGQDLPSIVPPSPEAAALGKYVDMPVTTSTGIPNISIPLYEINHGDLTLPISISYHAGGIRVEEIASRVGLGWSLNAGGIVSRTMRGLPDDVPGVGYMYETRKVSDIRNDYNKLGSSAIYEDIQSSELGGTDLEPDIFSFSFMGYSGKFMFDQNSRVFVQMPFSNMKIKPIYDSANLKTIVGWVFTAPDGVKFYFGISEDKTDVAVDVSTSADMFNYTTSGLSLSRDGKSIPNFISSWHLVDIVSPKGNNIHFEYGVELFSNTLKTSEQLIIEKNCLSSGYSVSFSTSLVQQRVLEKVSFGDNHIEFVSDEVSRMDLSGSKSLKDIFVFVNGGQTAIKQYRFNYDYFTSKLEEGRWRNIGNPQERRYRLKLLSVQEIGENNISKPPYKFEYNNILLPSRFSNAQDYWGFYNGKESNQNLIPSVRLASGIYHNNAERSVAPLSAKASTISKIHYPTGGSIEYSFESNRTYAPNNFNFSDTTVDKYLNFNKAPINEAPPGSLYAYSKEFDIEPGIIGQVHFRASVSGCDNNGPLTNLECDYTLKIVGVTDPSFSMNVSTTSFSLELEPGTYKIVASEAGFGLGESEGEESNFNMSLSWKLDETPDPSDGMAVGGLRISEINIKDEFGNTITKTYDYNKFDTGKTSGVLYSIPVFLDSRFFNGSCTSSPPKYVHKVTSYSQVPFIFVNGGVLLYKNVTEYINNNIKTEFVFTSRGSMQHYDYKAGDGVYLPELDVSWERANLKEKTIYKNVSGLYSPVSYIENNYEQKEVTPYPNVGVIFKNEIGGSGFTVGQFGFYSFFSEWYRLKSVKKIDFFEGNNVISIKENKYLNNSLIPSEEITSNSQNETLTTKTYYPDDITSPSFLAGGNITSVEYAAIDRLKAVRDNGSKGLHRVSAPIQVETYKDN